MLAIFSYVVQMCAYKEYTDTCGGDSGGPLTATIHQNKLPKTNFLLGTVSYGAQECAKIG